MLKLICITFVLVFISCVEMSVPQKSPIKPTPVSTLAWETNHIERQSWSTELRHQLTRSYQDLTKASDWANYCISFRNLNQDQQIEVMATMIVAIALYESSYDASNITPDVGNTNSIGLFQLSYEDHMSFCAMDSNKKNLTDPMVNIDCAVREMAKLISKDGVVSFGGSAQFHAHTEKGLARYWSTMWDNGKLSQIKSKTNGLSFCK